MSMKSFLYRSAITFLRLFWGLYGGRRIKAFGQELTVTSDTAFPSYRKLRLPKDGCLSEIVKYADYVQFHAICNFVSASIKKTVIVDVGAHHGAYAIVLGKIVQKKGGKVIALEPNPVSFNILEKNVFLNGLEQTVICQQVAVSDRLGKAHITFDDTQSHLTTQSDEGVDVEVTTLSQLLKQHQVTYLDLLLVDVEGAELPVLRGFPWDIITVDRIFCELHPYAWKNFGYHGEDLQAFLKAHNYRCIDMYLQEHKAFNSESYIGPTFFVQA